jgi:predicted dehydrogenase
MGKKRCLMIGAGGMAGRWISDFWTPFLDRVEFAGLVDIDSGVLHAAADALSLAPTQRFTDMQEAFARVDADFCCIVVPPGFHREAVELACSRSMDILSEKPIADTWDACVAIYRAVHNAGVRMMVTQNFRYVAPILTLKGAVGSLGQVNYTVARYASDYRIRGSWGMFRHELAHGLLVEGGIHHLDQVRNICGADCLRVTGWEWHPGRVRGDVASWQGSDSFDGEPCALLVLQMTNGSFASYEGNNLATGKTNSWLGEYYRVECEGGAAVLDRDHMVWIEERSPAGTLQIREVPRVSPRWEGHWAIAVQFLDWMDGSPAPATTLDDNLQSNATMFAAIQSSETGLPVHVQDMVRQVMATT